MPQAVGAALGHSSVRLAARLVLPGTVRMNPHPNAEDVRRCDCKFCQHNERKRCECPPCQYIRRNWPNLSDEHNDGPNSTAVRTDTPGEEGS